MVVTDRWVSVTDRWVAVTDRCVTVTDRWVAVTDRWVVITDKYDMNDSSRHFVMHFVCFCLMVRFNKTYGPGILLYIIVVYPHLADKPRVPYLILLRLYVIANYWR